MKIDLNTIDQEQFMVHPHVLNGETLWLVQPQHIGAKYTQANKHFRSSVWNDAGELVSAGFPKFTNWGENPENFPLPNSLKNTQIVEKIDGSLLIVSKYKGNYIIRTRGTVDASSLDNGHEIEIFKQKMFPLIDGDSDTWEFSVLFEWVSPSNRIILNYGDQPDWYLVGIVNHSDYSLTSQPDLNQWATQHGLKRPPSYTFPTIEALLADVEKWKGKEGVCVYSMDGQRIHKVKAFSYLFLHKMKSELGSVEKVIDVWFNLDCPDYQVFEKYIIDTFDFELWNMVRPDASRICDAYKEVKKIIAGMGNFVTETLLPMQTRREQAERVLAAYGKTNRASFVFALLDGRVLDKEQEKKLLYQCLRS